MRAPRIPVCLIALAALGSAAACGPAKPAESPSQDESPSAPASSTTGDSDVRSLATAPPPPPPPSVTSPPSGSGVPYDKEAVEVVLKRAARQVKANCGATTNEEGKATGPWGKLDVTVKLGHNGHSAGATVPAPYDGKPVGRCITNAFSILQYPPFGGGDVAVDWPVEVVQPAAAH